MYTERRSREEAGVVSQHGTVGAETHLEKRENQKILRVWRKPKVFLLLTFIAMLSVNSMAQDVILKQDGSEIKAKVLEITDQQIKYKDFDFQEGPMRNINISEVFMITYENGKKEVFNKQNSTPSVTAAPKDTAINSQILQERLKREFYSIGTDDAAMLDFFGKNKHYDYDNRFASACKQSNTGKALLIAGGGFTGLGFICILVGTTNGSAGSIVTGYAFLSVGQGLIIAGIPVTAVAGARKKAIKNEFARKILGVSSYTYQPTLNFGITQNGGVGFTLNF